MIPVSILTGFLGAGKTTLLRRVLADPAWADSAVVINEFGDIPLDHHLIATGAETFVSAATGCLCCVLRSDLGSTLLDLMARRDAGELPPYRRVLVETSGLADPAPILQAVMSDMALLASHRLESVTTLIDGVVGAATIDHHPEARRQVLLADRVVLTKPDLAGDLDALRDAIRALNPAAEQRVAAHGALPPDWVFAPAPSRPVGLADWAAQHTKGVASIVIDREVPIPAMALTLWMQALAEHAGARLLRMKGLVALAEFPAKPAEVHVVQHMASPITWLDAWPGIDQRTRLVLITERLPPHWPARLLAAIEAEVASASA